MGEIIENNQKIKSDAGKPQFSDIPQLALLEVAKAFNYGANKYSKFSYSEGLEWLRYYDAAQRHLHAWMLNEDMDQESGNSHLSHATASLMMLIEAIRTSQGIDNRNKLYKNN